MASAEELSDHQAAPGAAAGGWLPDEDPPDPLLGTTLDERYRIVRRLGAGGMGAVYVAIQQPVGREVAVKVLLPEVLRGKAALRFNQEAQAISLLRSPHTVTLIDFGRSQDRQYLVMELLSGRTLEQALQDCRRMAPDRAIHIFSQACDSLAEAHARGIIHRDIKPANLFLVETVGTVDFVKVLDFGIAIQTLNPEAGGLTTTGMLLGTAAYVAPEVAQGDPASAASDVYALGVVLFQLLTGRRPFVRDSPNAMVIAHVNDPIPRLRALGFEDVPAVLQELIDRLLAKHPADRPQSILEARELAQRALELLGEAAWVPLTGPELPPAEPAVAGSDRLPRRKQSSGLLDPAPPPAGPGPGWFRRVPAWVGLILLALLLVGAVAGLLGLFREAGTASTGAPDGGAPAVRTSPATTAHPAGADPTLGAGPASSLPSVAGHPSSSPAVVLPAGRPTGTAAATSPVVPAQGTRSPGGAGQPSGVARPSRPRPERPAAAAGARELEGGADAPFLLPD